MRPETHDDDVEVHEFELGGEEFAVLAFELMPRRLAERLSPAELEVVQSLLRGLPPVALAEARGCSLRTVQNLLGRAYRKLGVNSLSELISVALERESAEEP